MRNGMRRAAFPKAGERQWAEFLLTIYRIQSSAIFIHMRVDFLLYRQSKPHQ